MSWVYSIRSYFRAAYSRAVVGIALDHIARIVRENWERFGDRWSGPIADFTGFEWLRKGGAEQLEGFGRGGLFARCFSFSHSPLTLHPVSCGVGMTADGCLRISFSVARDAPYERAGEREQRRMEAQWLAEMAAKGLDPGNRKGPFDLDDPIYDNWWKRFDELDETEFVWPRVRRHLQLIIEGVCKVLPPIYIELSYVSELEAPPEPLIDPQWNAPAPVHVGRGPVSASIAYDAKPDDNAILAWHAALEEAVRENWRMYRDRWSEAEPDFPTPQWPRAGRSLEWRTQSDGAQMWWAQVPFSPLTWRQARVELVRAPDGMLRATLSCGETPFEEAGDREQYRMRLAWQQTLKSRGIDAPWQVGPEESEPGAAEWWARWHSLENTPLVWAQNCQCLRHIIDRLCRVFPVTKLEMDDRLRKDVTDR
jgi:hypothetical protein